MPAPKAIGTYGISRPAPASAAIHSRNFAVSAGHAPRDPTGRQSTGLRRTRLWPRADVAAAAFGPAPLRHPLPAYATSDPIKGRMLS
jgi:hypothetical protein